MTKQTAFGWLLVFVQVLIFLGFILLPWREPSALALIIGLILAAGGIAIAAVTFRSLGDALTATPVPRAGAALSTQGIFGVVRHPIYSGVLLALLGFVIAVGSWWSLGWWLAIHCCGRNTGGNGKFGRREPQPLFPTVEDPFGNSSRPARCTQVILFELPNSRTRISHQVSDCGKVGYVNG